MVDAGWLVGAVLLTLACLAREGRYEAPRQTGLLIIAVPAVFVMSSLALLTYGQGRALPAIAIVCALASIVLALLRLGLTFREVQGLAETRRLARTDDLTGLANRRLFYEQLNDRLRNRSPASHSWPSSDHRVCPRKTSPCKIASRSIPSRTKPAF